MDGNDENRDCMLVMLPDSCLSTVRWSEMSMRDIPIPKLCKKSRRYEGNMVRED